MLKKFYHLSALNDIDYLIEKSAKTRAELYLRVESLRKHIRPTHQDERFQNQRRVLRTI